MFAGEANAQSGGSLDYKERFALQAVRTFFSAEMTYQSTIGAGLFGTMAELRQANMIDGALASGENTDTFLRFQELTQAQPRLPDLM